MASQQQQGRHVRQRPQGNIIQLIPLPAEQSTTESAARGLDFDMGNKIRIDPILFSLRSSLPLQSSIDQDLDVHLDLKNDISEVPLPKNELSFSVLPIQVMPYWSYSLGLAGVLVLWLFYLLLPKGVRAHFFGGYPRRYPRRSQKQLKRASRQRGTARQQVKEQKIFSMRNNNDPLRNNNMDGLNDNWSLSPSQQSSITEGVSLPIVTTSRSAQSKQSGTSGPSLTTASNTRQADRQRRQDMMHTLKEAKVEGSRLSPNLVLLGEREREQKPEDQILFVNSQDGMPPYSYRRDDEATEYSESGIGRNRSYEEDSSATNNNYNNDTNNNDTGSGIHDMRSVDGCSDVQSQLAPQPSNPTSNKHHQPHRILSIPPSPKDPRVKKRPVETIVSETMNRLNGRGIRLLAHGVHCRPKRVWIRLDQSKGVVSWQTESPRRIDVSASTAQRKPIMMVRGSVHEIALTSILYIDVGKKTNALLKEESVENSTCLSLLTGNGSLDLQANSKLERDSLVSCFSLALDEVHRATGRDWRALYETTPTTSAAGTMSDFNNTDAIAMMSDAFIGSK